MVRKAGVYTLLFIINHAKKEVLLIRKKRGFGSGKWNGVGGKVEDTERIREAVIRESHEECGLTPLNPEWKGMLFFENYDPHRDAWEDMLVHVYTADAWEGELEESDEALPAWHPISQLPLEEMWEDDAYWLTHVLEGKRVSGRFTFHDWKLKEHTLITSKG